MNIKFKLFLPFLVLLFIILVFGFKLIFIINSESIVESKNDEIFFYKTKSILTGDEIKLKKNNGYIILNFFSTKCEQCINELPELEYLNKKNIKIYGIVVDQEKSSAINWLNKFGNCFEDVLMINYKSYKNIGYSKFPITIILKNNKIVYKFEDNINQQLIEKIIFNNNGN